MNKMKILKKLMKHSRGPPAFFVLPYLICIVEQPCSELIEISQEELSEKLLISRPTLNSALKILKQEKMINFGYGKIYVKENWL